MNIIKISVPHPLEQFARATRHIIMGIEIFQEIFEIFHEILKISNLVHKLRTPRSTAP